MLPVRLQTKLVLRAQLTINSIYKTSMLYTVYIVSLKMCLGIQRLHLTYNRYLVCAFIIRHTHIKSNNILILTYSLDLGINVFKDLLGSPSYLTRDAWYEEWLNIHFLLRHMACKDDFMYIWIKQGFHTDSARHWLAMSA